MTEWGIQPEHVQQGLHALGLLALSMAFTARQRAWIKERDNNVCQACILGLPHSSPCTGSPDIPEEDRKNQVHHIIPQRYARVIGMETADFPENGIVLGSKFHQEDIHPDMRQALEEYRGGDKGAFHQVGIDRDAMLNEGVIYWNDEHDRLLSTRAIQNTQRFEPGNPFPDK